MIKFIIKTVIEAGYSIMLSKEGQEVIRYSAAGLTQDVSAKKGEGTVQDQRLKSYKQVQCMNLSCREECKTQRKTLRRHRRAGMR